MPKPLTAAACSSIAAPPDETNDSLPDSTRTPPPQRLRFTYGVPSSRRIWTFDKPNFPCWTGTSVHYAPTSTTITRKIEARAGIGGDNNVATVTGNNSSAVARLGDDNTATVTANFSSAIAGPDDNNTATATGDRVFGATAVGNGTEVNCTREGCS